MLLGQETENSLKANSESLSANGWKMQNIYLTAVIAAQMSQFFFLSSNVRKSIIWVHGNKTRLPLWTLVEPMLRWRVTTGSKVPSSVYNFLVFISFSNFLCNETQNLIKRSHNCWVSLFWGRIAFCLTVAAAYLFAIHYLRPQFQSSPKLHERRRCVCACVQTVFSLCMVKACQAHCHHYQNTSE